VRGREAGWDFNMRIRDSFEWVPREVERVDAGADKVFAHIQYDLRGAGSGAEVELISGTSPQSVTGGSFACSGSRTVSTPSKPPGCGSRGCRRRIWRPSSEPKRLGTPRIWTAGWPSLIQRLSGIPPFSKPWRAEEAPIGVTTVCEGPASMPVLCPQRTQ
jgi:hypothetical protein